jgi:capsular polysaccharide biosynthesis protein
MELRQYWRIVSRRWWVVATLLAIVLIVSLLTYHPPAPLFQATMRFAVGIQGQQPVQAISGEGRSDAWLASEYLADDLSEVLKGGDFRSRIGEELGIAIPAGAISASREHRIMSVSITMGDPERLQAVAEAVGAAVSDGGAGYFPQLDGVHAQAVLIDGPGISRVGRSLKDTLDIPIRLLVALAAGVALTFLWDYLDGSIRDRSEVEALGIPILGEIPKRSSLWSRLRRS